MLLNRHFESQPLLGRPALPHPLSSTPTLQSLHTYPPVSPIMRYIFISPFLSILLTLDINLLSLTKNVVNNVFRQGLKSFCAGFLRGFGPLFMYVVVFMQLYHILLEYSTTSCLFGCTFKSIKSKRKTVDL